MVAETIDVVVCTWNSATTLAECLSAIRAHVPVATLWVIDRFSTDETVSICRRFDCSIVQSDCNLGLARRLGIDHVRTEMFAFIDADYIVCDGWFDRMSGYWTDRSGLMTGRHRIVCAVHAYERYRNARRSDAVLVQPKGRGGGTENALVRTAAVKDAIMPANVGGREDWILAEHVKARGYEVSEVPVYSKHYTANPYKQQLWAGGGARRLNRLGLGFKFPLFRSATALVIDGMKWAARGDLAVAWLLVRLATLTLAGYVIDYGYDRA